MNDHEIRRWLSDAQSRIEIHSADVFNFKQSLHTPAFDALMQNQLNATLEEGDIGYDYGENWQNPNAFSKKFGSWDGMFGKLADDEYTHTKVGAGFKVEKRDGDLLLTPPEMADTAREIVSSRKVLGEAKNTLSDQLDTHRENLQRIQDFEVQALSERRAIINGN